MQGELLKISILAISAFDRLEAEVNRQVTIEQNARWIESHRFSYLLFR